MPHLAEMLVPRLDGAVADELVAIADLDLVLANLVAAGCQAHPDLLLPDAHAAWTEHLVRHLAPGEVASRLAALRSADVHLVLACLAGDPQAHARLDERLRRVASQALAGIRLGSISVDELLQDVLAKLLVDHDGAGKLGSYSGRGPLEGWLRVTLSRTALSALRGRSPETAPADGPNVLVELAASEDPRLEAIRARCAPALEHAIENAVASLATEDRTLLRLHFIDGLTIDDLAVVYRLHRATLARRLAKARNAVFETARARAMIELGLDEAEFRSLMGMMLSGLDFTLSRVLDGPSASGTKDSP
jgi:RNA polymerase sigma-70 factor (ECF subfamily)